MQIRYCLLLFLALHIISNTEPTLKPSDTTKLHEWTYLCTHNAFSSTGHYYGPYRQQDLSMAEQLKRGVRALMLDTWMANKVVRLTHGSPAYDKLLRGTLGGHPTLLFQEGMHFKEELETLKKEFFDKPENAGEVVFIFLENHVEDHAMLDQAFIDSGLAQKILKPSEWGPGKQGGWPTFKWMRDNKKQIVVFGEGHTKPTTYIYPLWRHVYENQFGVITNKEAAEQRKESRSYNDKGRFLFLFNFFKDYAQAAFADPSNLKFGIISVVDAMNKLDFSKINSTEVSNAVNYSVSDGNELVRDRYPNFIALDFFETGNGFKVVDEINKKTQENPSSYYRAILKK